MKILVLSESLPLALHDGGNLRLAGILRGLKFLGHAADLAAFHAGPLGQAASGLNALCRRAAWVRLGPWGRGLRALAALPGPVPANVAAYRRPAMFRLVSRMLAEERPDLVLACRLRMAPYALAFQGPRVLDLTDCLGLYSLRSRRGADAWWERLFHRIELPKLRRYEPGTCGGFDGVFVTSPVDREALGLAEGRCAVVGNGVDLAERPYGPLEGRSGILFLGNMGYGPNREAARWLVRDIAPRVWRSRKSELRLVGAHPPVPARMGDVSAPGIVADLKPCLASARVMAVPLKRGAGVQNKVLDALASGLPVVATGLAGEGLGLEDGGEYLRADTSDDFARAVLRVLEDDGLAGRLARAGREKAEREFTWEAQWARLDAVIRAAAEKGR